MTENYIIRKNQFYESSRFYYLGLPTEILGVYTDFEDAKKVMNTELVNVFNRMLSNNYFEYNSPFHYKLQMFMKHAKGSTKRDFGYEYNGEFFLKKIETIQDAEILNLLYPTNSVEILLNKNDFLYSPQFNSDYFKLTNKSIPNLNFDEYAESICFLDKGLYIDELDFFNSALRDYNKNTIINIYNNLDVSNSELINKSDLSEFFPSIVKDDKTSIRKINYETLFKLNSLLKIKPFIFKKIENKSINEFQVKNYKKIILEGKEYMDPYNADSIESLSETLSFPLSLTNNLIKSILIED